MRFLPSLASGFRAQRLLEPRPGTLVRGVLAQEAPKDVGGLLRETLLEADRAERRGHEHVIAQHAPETALRDAARAGAEQPQRRFRVAIAGIQSDRGLEVPHRG